MNDEENGLEEENQDLRRIIEEFLKDPRVGLAIAKDCTGEPCTCLYCRARKAL